MDAAQFRIDFPEFADTTAYPNGQVGFALSLATLLLNADRWADVLNYGIELFTAHQLALGAKNIEVSAFGGIPGAQVGVLSAKQVKDVSMSYDNSGAMEEGAGHWNLTNYGLRYIQLARMAGMGGYYAGAGCGYGWGYTGTALWH